MNSYRALRARSPVAGQCDACGAPVLWLRHVRTMRVAPIDAEPSADGNCLVDAADGCYQIFSASGVRRVRSMRGASGASGASGAVGTAVALHGNHFDTCPMRPRPRLVAS